MNCAWSGTLFSARRSCDQGAVEATQSGWAGRLRHELVQYALTALYLYACLGAIVLHKAAILQAQGINYAPYGFAAIKALILAKFVLLARAAHVGEKHRNKPLAYYIAIQVLFYTAVIYGLSVIEEIVTSAVHGRSITVSVLNLGGTWLLTLSDCVLAFLFLTPYLAFISISDALGPRQLHRMFFGDG